jgi:hypothetical protein
MLLFIKLYNYNQSNQVTVSSPTGERRTRERKCVIMSNLRDAISLASEHPVKIAVNPLRNRDFEVEFIKSWFAMKLVGLLREWNRHSDAPLRAPLKPVMLVDKSSLDELCRESSHSIADIAKVCNDVLDEQGIPARVDPSKGLDSGWQSTHYSILIIRAK